MRSERDGSGGVRRLASVAATHLGRRTRGTSCSSTTSTAERGTGGGRAHCRSPTSTTEPFTGSHSATPCRSSGLFPRYGHVTAPLLILKLSYAILISLENGATFAKTLRFAA